MNLIGQLTNFSRNFKYRHEKKNDEDLVDLLESNEISIKRKQMRFCRRISILIYIRNLILISLLIYLLIILTPIKHLQSFVPREIQTKKNFLIVVAHPDDECLFFSPTIVGLQSRSKRGHILVLSTGNSLGLGPIREKELQGSCLKFGIDSTRCLSLNITDLQDNPKQWWPKRKISQLIQKYVEQFQIDLLITFDHGGISGHLNHRSISLGVEYYIENADETPLIYEISTAAALFEYSSIIDICRTIIKFFPRLIRGFVSTFLPFLFSPPNDQRALFVSSPLGYLQGLQAFHAHHSQVLWYRHIYTALSRHMFINDLIKVSRH